jgi:sulfur carrier protein ThiS
MDHEMRITLQDGYLLTELSGQHSYDAIRDELQRLKEACSEYNCYRILGLSTMSSMEVVEAYQVPDLMRELEFTSKYTWAWVVLNKDAEEVPQFVETVLKNRGLLNGAFFTDKDEALEWLLKQS